MRLFRREIHLVWGKIAQRNQVKNDEDRLENSDNPNENTVKTVEGFGISSSMFGDENKAEASVLTHLLTPSGASFIRQIRREFVSKLQINLTELLVKNDLAYAEI